MICGKILYIILVGVIDVDLHYLEIFYEVAKSGSFTRAAEKLFINQSAVSIQIKKFESVLGSKLFDRRTKKVKLTYTGEALYKMAEEIFEKIKRSEKEITKIIQMNKSKISIGASPIIAEPLLPELIKKFTEEHSEIEYDITVSNKNHLVKLLKEGEVDVILIDEEHIRDNELDIIELKKVPYVLISENSFSNIREVARFPLISRKDINNNDRAIEILENKYRLSFDDQISVVGNLAVIKSMVRQKIANVILPYYAVAKEIQEGEFKLVAAIDEIKDGYQIVVTKDKREQLNISNFISFVEENII